MRIRFSLAAAAIVFAAAFVSSTVTSGQGQAPAQSAPAARPGGWTIPPDADKETNPMAGNQQAIAER